LFFFARGGGAVCAGEWVGVGGAYRFAYLRKLGHMPNVFLVQVWKRFAQFEQTYGDLASMLKVAYLLPVFV